MSSSPRNSSSGKAPGRPDPETGENEKRREDSAPPARPAAENGAGEGVAGFRAVPAPRLDFAAVRHRQLQEEDLHEMRKRNPVSVSSLTIVGLLAGYLTWNLYFCFQGRFPVSIFTAVTGMPCPSSGCIRSLSAYAAGEFKLGFLYNPMSLGMVLLLAASALWLGYNYCSRRSLLLPRPFLYLWCGILSLAWILKLLIPCP